jgi:hypothetical protein
VSQNCIKCGKSHDLRDECPGGESESQEEAIVFFDLKPKYCTCPRESIAWSGGLKPGDILYFASDCPIHGRQKLGRQ